MNLRKARQGKYAGKHFFGCPKYPACREIINYELNLHGSIENLKKKTSKPKSEEQAKTLLLEFPSVKRRVLPNTPVNFIARERFREYQCKFFENSFMPSHLLPIVHRRRVNSSILRSLCQWRLDFPLPKVLFPISFFFFFLCLFI